MGYAIIGLLLSLFFAKETIHHVAIEAQNHTSQVFTQKEIFLKTSFSDKNLSSVSQAGFVNNLNDGMAWGLFPFLYASFSMSLSQMGWLAAIYPATWGVVQLFTGYLSDVYGRKWLIVWGMWIQAVGIAITALSSEFLGFAISGLLLGIGTAMVYPTLLATIGDVAHPKWRASAVGIYRLWRDSGYAIGAIMAGIVADFFGLHAAIWLVAAITFISGLIVLMRQVETKDLRASGK